MAVIKPTVGRVLWYYPQGSTEHTQPQAAVVSAVWGDRCVNLMVIGENGVPMSHPPTSVLLVQDGDQLPRLTDGTLGRHCRWMPYQLGQAAKTEAAERAAAG